MMKNFIRYAAATASVLIIAASSASACTGLTLKARNGATVYGRTLEWGAFDLHSEIIVVPRGISLSSQMEDGGKAPSGPRATASSRSTASASRLRWTA